MRGFRLYAIIGGLILAAALSAAIFRTPDPGLLPGRSGSDVSSGAASKPTTYSTDEQRAALLAAVESGRVEELNAFLRKFPDSPFADDARRELLKLEPPQPVSNGAPPRSSPVPTLTPAPDSSPPPPATALPDFPWPPPEPSAFYALPAKTLGGPTTLGQAVDAIVDALDRAGYADRSFYRIASGGTALVTRLERIDDEGAPAAKRRWTATVETPDLPKLLSALFFADPGRYRVIVFVFGSAPITPSSSQATGEQAEEWLTHGADRLPHETRRQAYDDQQCTALIYEFKSDGKHTRKVKTQLTGKSHLEHSGILAALGKRD